MADSTSRTYWKILIALSLVHFSGDFYSSFINPLFPVFMDKMGLSLAQVGFLAGISRFLMFIVQPMSGYWADRHPSRSFILIGLLMPILFIPLAGMTTGFYGLLFCIVIGSTGSSLFHPPVTGMVPLYAGRNLGLAMSIYNTCRHPGLRGGAHLHHLVRGPVRPQGNAGDHGHRSFDLDLFLLGHSQTQRGRHGPIRLFRDTSANPGQCLAADPVDLDRNGCAIAGGSVVDDLYAGALGAERTYHRLRRHPLFHLYHFRDGGRHSLRPSFGPDGVQTPLMDYPRSHDPFPARVFVGSRQMDLSGYDIGWRL